MDLDDLLKEYWPIVVGVVVALVTAVVLWPSEELSSEGPGSGPVAITPLTEEARRALAQRQAREQQAESQPVEAAPDQGPSDRAPEYEFLEIVEAVPIEGGPVPGREFKTGDPEVQRALEKVQVTLYQEKECAPCSTARDFLEKNGVSVTARDVDQDANLRERARRLSGSRSLPVLVIDEKVLLGFSESAVQAALTSAVKSRVESELRPKPGL